ncbi:branched-chain amino acid ABC transporter permease [Rhizobium sp. CNPSo 4039]|uniref:branched-chain amino acid ABC transporter permease n=1 Tax=Rhizobium sp. CNPSo 4039 TaxID=3021409 RepID=UPI00254A7BCB|nr:branched-chain amino acid ABC transporter permease [Rhizobium sp. CNPSo 4039]MDK4716331.1 branched-chain amino acid ABC transporter permease [Rhizobium sp. CNPSo 4039]
MFQFLVDVLMRACDLMLVAIGMSAVYSLMKFPNIALVQYAATGGVLAIVLQKTGMPVVIAIAFAVLLTGLLAVIFNEFLFNRMLKIGSSTAMIGSLAVSMIFSAGFLVTVGPSPSRFAMPLSRPVRILDARITEPQLLSFAIVAAAIGMFALLYFRTDLGRCMRATSTNEVLADATGINTARMKTIIVLISGVMAALGGVAIALKGEVDIQMGMDLLLPVFASAILGGLGNPFGAIAGALLISFAETAVTAVNFGPLLGQVVAFLPVAYASAISFLLLVAALLWRPRGLFVSEVKRV